MLEVGWRVEGGELLGVVCEGAFLGPLWIMGWFGFR